MATREDRSSTRIVPQVRLAAKWRAQILGRVLAAAALAFLLGQTVQAQFFVQSIGLQAQARPNTTVIGQIRLLNASREQPLSVRLSTVELIKAEDRQWKPWDPNGSTDPNSRPDVSKVRSCRGWVCANLSETVVNPIDLVIVPVVVRIPASHTGSYRAAIAISVCDPSPVGVGVQHEIVIPVLLEIKDDEDLATIVPDRYVVEVCPRPLKLCQDTTTSDPYHTYTGTRKAEVTTSFESRLAIAGIVATSAAGGEWKASLQEDTISVTGEHVSIDKLVGGAKDVHVAMVTIQVIPVPSAWPIVWWDL